MDFQSSIQDIDEVTKKITVTVGKDRVVKEYEDSVKQVGRTASIKGFRPGRVPRQMVERLMGDRIKFDVTNKLINEGLRTAFEEHKLDTVGEPQIDLKEMQTASDLEFSATVEMYPQPAVANYLDRAITVVKKSVTDKEVDAALERLAESRAELKPIEDHKEAALGDVVALSVSIQVEAEEFSRPEPFVEELGLGKLSKEVEEKLVGLPVGESRDVAITGGDDHPNESLRGKQLTYRCQLHGLYTKNMPTMDDAFAKSLGMEVESVEALRNKIREQLVTQAERDVQAESQGELLNLLVQENQFKVPSALVDDEIRSIVARYGFAGKQANPESIDVKLFRPQFEEFAVNRIRSAIIIDRIGSQEDVKVEESDRDAMIKRVAEENGMTAEAAKKALLNKSRIMSFLLEVRRTKILDFLMSRTKVEFVPEKESKK